MKNNYVAPEAEIVVLSENDILLLSSTNNPIGDLKTLDWAELISLK